VDERFVDRNAIQIAPALQRSSRTRTLHQDLTHRSRRDADEVPFVVPWGAGAGEPQVGLVDERGGLEGLARLFPSHVGSGESPQLVVNKWRQGCRVAWITVGSIGHEPFAPDTAHYPVNRRHGPSTWPIGDSYASKALASLHAVSRPRVRADSSICQQR